MMNIRTMFAKQLQTITVQGKMENNTILSKSSEPSDPWWRQARYSMLQSWGMLDAFNLQVDKVAGRPMSFVDLMILNSDGETPELEMAYDMEESLLRQSEHDSASDDAGDKQSFLQRTRSVTRTKTKKQAKQQLRRE